MSKFCAHCMKPLNAHFKPVVEQGLGGVEWCNPWCREKSRVLWSKSASDSNLPTTWDNVYNVWRPEEYAKKDLS